jgi:lipopolysaccharide transport system ATP-binding protein
MDTPVKRYSKGMRARLGMAVALNLSPEVLVVDEVLAVGDVPFRAKCMERIEAMCNAGTTLLFVSHSVARVKALCERALLLRQGTLIEDGDVSAVLDRYVSEDLEIKVNSEIEIEIDDENDLEKSLSYLGKISWDIDDAPGDDLVQILEVRVTDFIGNEKQIFDIRDPVILEMTYIVHGDGHVLRPQFQVFDKNLNVLFASIDATNNYTNMPRVPGKYISVVTVPGNLLAPNEYIVGASVYSHIPLVKHARTADVISFSIVQPIGRLACLETAQSDYPRYLGGVFRPLLQWKTSNV